MKIYFSPSTRSLYNDDVHGSRTMMVPDPKWKAPKKVDGDAPPPEAPFIEVTDPDAKIPPDAVEITLERWAECVGKTLGAGPDGMPVVVAPPGFPPEILLADLRITRNKLLYDTDGPVNRHRDEKERGGATTLSDAEIAKLQSARQVLRDLPANTVDPAKPEWPDLSKWVAPDPSAAAMPAMAELRRG